jgi:hypothetical protein
MGRLETQTTHPRKNGPRFNPLFRPSTEASAASYASGSIPVDMLVAVHQPVEGSKTISPEPPERVAARIALRAVKRKFRKIWRPRPAVGSALYRLMTRAKTR